jgi:hypothetical protein
MAPDETARLLAPVPGRSGWTDTSETAAIDREGFVRLEPLDPVT